MGVRGQTSFAFAAALVTACALLGGCGGARGCVSGCGGQHDGGPPMKSLPPCPALRACPHYLSLELHRTPFGVPYAGDQGGTVGGLVETPEGPAVSWIAANKRGGPLHVGVTLLLSGQAAVIGPIPYTKKIFYAPLFARGSEVDVLMPPDFKTVVPVDVDTLHVGAPIPTVLDPGGHTGLPEVFDNTPAVLGVGRALAAVTGDPPRLQLLDATLSDRLVDVSLGDYGQPRSLVATCNGLLAAWSTDFGVRVAPFTRFAERAGPDVLLDPDKPLTYDIGSSTWDGAEDVVTGKSTVLELDSAGNVLSATPVSAFAAVGSDDGLLSLEIGGAELYQRGTGKKLASYAVQSDDLCPASGWGVLTLVVDHTVYVVGNGATWSCLPWTRVVCGP